MISFTAYGTPAPKGSTKAFFRPGMRFPIVTEDNKHTRPWAAIVKDAARQAIHDQSIPFAGGPVFVSIHFHMPRPKSLPRRITAHTKKPDLDKLVRAVKDALTGILWTDDSQVVTLTAHKSYIPDGLMPCAIISVEESGSHEMKPVGGLCL